MDSYKQMYQEFIDKDLTYIVELNNDLKFYKKLYAKKVFEEELPILIKDAITGIKKEINETIKEISYNIKQADERIKYAAIAVTQPQENRDDVTEEVRKARNTYFNSSKTERENMGITLKETDNHWG